MGILIVFLVHELKRNLKYDFIKGLQAYELKVIVKICSLDVCSMI